MKARWEVIKITVGSERAPLLGKCCKCFSRNPAQVNVLQLIFSSSLITRGPASNQIAGLGHVRRV